MLNTFKFKSVIFLLTLAFVMNNFINKITIETKVNPSENIVNSIGSTFIAKLSKENAQNILNKLKIIPAKVNRDGDVSIEQQEKQRGLLQQLNIGNKSYILKAVIIENTKFALFEVIDSKLKNKTIEKISENTPFMGYKLFVNNSTQVTLMKGERKIIMRMYKKDEFGVNK